LHAQGIIHRDIKSANILVDATYQHVKIADFGSSRVLAEPKALAAPPGAADAEGAADGVQTLKGTPFWMAPEVIQGMGYGRKADVWSVGCVCVEMLTGRPPWSSELGDKAHPYAIMYHIVNAPDAPEYPAGLPGLIGAVRRARARARLRRPRARGLTPPPPALARVRRALRPRRCVLCLSAIATSDQPRASCSRTSGWRALKHKTRSGRAAVAAQGLEHGARGRVGRAGLLVTRDIINVTSRSRLQSASSGWPMRAARVWRSRHKPLCM
jgi:serine/threonine protein kinase